MTCVVLTMTLGACAPDAAVAYRAIRDRLRPRNSPADTYLSIRRDGSWYGGVRDYAGAGLARRFHLAPGAVIEVSGRLHRTERFVEYSYRVLSIASLKWRVR